MKKFLKILGIIVGIFIVVVIAGIIYLNSAYPDVEPVKNIKIISTPEKLMRGEYLANHVMVCMDCHSQRDWNKFSGPIMPATLGKGGDKFDENTGFPGTLYMKNITPAAIGNWTDGEIARAITIGVNKDGEALFPMMPYPNYNQMTQEDLEAIIVYIRSLKPIENEVPERELNFPLSLIVKTMPIHSYSPKQINKSNTIEYGEYLATMGGCKFCHSQSDQGEVIEGLELAGGEGFQLPSGVVASANITPDKETGIGSWSKERFISTFKTFTSDSAKNIPTDFMKDYNTVMPWTLFAGMTEEDLSAIYDYLMSVKPVSHKVVKFTPAADQFANKN